MSSWNDENVNRCRDYEVFLQYLLVAITANVKIAVKVTNFQLMREIVSVMRLLLVTVWCTRLMRLIR